MIRALSVYPAGLWSKAPADAVVLDFDARHRRRIAMTAKGGTEFLLDLPEAVALKQGDGLLLEDGRIIAVEAAPEALVEVSGKDGAHLLRLAWHLGNRHLPTELLGDRLRIRRDHVIEDMLVQLGAYVVPVDAPFHPEGGAYGHGRVHGHDDHDHAEHEHAHAGDVHDHHDHVHHDHDNHAHAHDLIMASMSTGMITTTMTTSITTAMRMTIMVIAATDMIDGKR